MKITATKFDAYALANSAKSYIEMLKDKKVTMAYILKDWNVCVEQSYFTGVFDFPLDGYTRKAQIIADLENAIKQLNAYVEPSAEALEMNVSISGALTTDATNDGDLQMTTTNMNAVFAALTAGRSITFAEVESGAVFLASDFLPYRKMMEDHESGTVSYALTRNGLDMDFNEEAPVFLLTHAMGEALMIPHAEDVENIEHIALVLAEAVGNFALETRSDIEVISAEQVDSLAAAISGSSNPLGMAVTMAHALTGLSEEVCRGAIVALAQGA